MTLQKAINIFYPGYSTQSNFTLKEWFTAKEIVLKNRKKIDVYIKGNTSTSN